MFNERTTYTLLELAQSIQKTIAVKFVSAYWVKAEINKLNHYSQSGHCFPELLEKQGGKVVAQMRATMWRDDYRRINQQFTDTLGQPLNDGIKTLLLVRVNFDPVYGLTLRITDIDPTYTLGDIEREKQEAIRKLTEEGLFDRNRSLPFPLLPKRLAIISVESSKGLADFREIIDKNPFGYRFFYMLFPSLLQGDKAVGTITSQLNRIRKLKTHFDAVAIIRGGGDDIGLSCFNHYRLAKAIATYPLPVLSGIGHSTNETVTEMVTHYNAITPTKLAEFLIQAFHNFAIPVSEAQRVINAIPAQILAIQKENVQTTSQRADKNLRKLILANKTRLGNLSQQIDREVYRMVSHSRFLLHQSYSSLKGFPAKHLERNDQQVNQYRQQLIAQQEQLFQKQHDMLTGQGNLIRHLDPVNVLKRGFSITTHRGNVLRSPAGLKAGDTLSTKLYKGILTSIVEKDQETGP